MKEMMMILLMSFAGLSAQAAPMSIDADPLEFGHGLCSLRFTDNDCDKSLDADSSVPQRNHYSVALKVCVDLVHDDNGRGHLGSRRLTCFSRAADKIRDEELHEKIDKCVNDRTFWTGDDVNETKMKKAECIRKFFVEKSAAIELGATAQRGGPRGHVGR